MTDPKPLVLLIEGSYISFLKTTFIYTTYIKEKIIDIFWKTKSTNWFLLKSAKKAKNWYSRFFWIMFLLTNLTWKERKLDLFCTLPLGLIASIKNILQNIRENIVQGWFYETSITILRLINKTHSTFANLPLKFP